MRLKEVVIQGKCCGLETVEECILNWELHSMQMYPYNALEYEYKELKKDIKAYEAGELELPWNQIDEEVNQFQKEFEEWCRTSYAEQEDWIAKLEMLK